MIKEVQITTAGLNALEAIIWWFADPKRVAYHALSRVVRALFTPILQLVLGIALKRLMGFNPECSAEGYTQTMLLRRFINTNILSQDVMRNAFSILGAHYEIVSVSVHCVFAIRNPTELLRPTDRISCNGSEDRKTYLLARFRNLLRRPRAT